MKIGPGALLAVGFVLGIRHATDSDHLVALATVVSRRLRTRAALTIGALWGLGHTLMVLTAGGAIIGLGLTIPPRLGLALEMGVAAMLIALGALNLIRRPAARKALPQPPGWTLRPLAIGAVHGLAGSAAVALLVLASIHEPVLGFVYMALFGLGTMAGMMLLTTLMTVPLSALAGRIGGFERTLAAVTGGISLAFGLLLAYRLGITEGLLVGEPRWSPR